jgi:hypothetical protein
MSALLFSNFFSQDLSGRIDVEDFGGCLIADELSVRIVPE